MTSAGPASTPTRSPPAQPKAHAAQLQYFNRKYGRDAFLWEVRNKGFWAHGLRLQARPQIP
eukprot:2215556-Alexandrium_andersonii.AAC.1